MLSFTEKVGHLSRTASFWISGQFHSIPQFKRIELHIFKNISISRYLGKTWTLRNLQWSAIFLQHLMLFNFYCDFIVVIFFAIDRKRKQVLEILFLKLINNSAANNDAYFCQVDES